MNTYTSESVCSGHPDKICDQVSDAILDEALKKDKYSRVAVETMVTKNFVAMAGERSSKTRVDYESIARRVIKNLGYTIPKWSKADKSPSSSRPCTSTRRTPGAVSILGAGDQG